MSAMYDEEEMMGDYTYESRKRRQPGCKIYKLGNCEKQDKIGCLTCPDRVGGSESQ